MSMSFTSCSAIRLVLHSSADDIQFTSAQIDCSVAKVDPEYAIEHDESFVCVFVAVPYEVAFQANDLELVLVHFGDDLRLPLLVE